MPIGPGVICEIATMSVNICCVSHPLSVTMIFCTKESIAYPPPNPKIPILRYAQMSFKYIPIVSSLCLYALPVLSNFLLPIAQKR